MCMLKATIESFKSKAFKLYGNQYTILSDNLDKGTQTKVNILHNVCNNEFTVIANEFTRTSNQNAFEKSCLICRNRGLSFKEVSDKLEFTTNSRIRLLEYGKNLHDVSKVECTECKYIWKTRLHSLFENLKTNKHDSFGCPVCSGKKITEEIFKNRIDSIFKGKLIVKTPYINLKTEVEVFCTLCNSTFNSKPENLLYGSQCKQCFRLLRESKGIRNVTKILDNLNIVYEKEVSFKQCKYKKYLPFDFVIANVGKYFIIEYDGSQHTHGWNHNAQSLKAIQLRDGIKNTFCEKYKIPLLRLTDDLNKNELELKIKEFLAHYKLF